MRLIPKQTKITSPCTLLNMDGIKLLNSFKDCSVDLIVTDPPYKTTARGNSGNSGGMMQTEICKKGQMFKHNDISPKDSKGKVLHVTAKPPELMEVLIKNSSKEGELVCDPFSGLFSTAIACKRQQRNFIGSEIDKHYYDLGVDLFNDKQIEDVRDYECVY